MEDRPRGGVIEVFADIGCPFTHVGLRRFVERRDELGRSDVRLRVRSWPLEVVNGQPLDPDFIAEEVEDLRAQVVPDLFVGFSAAAFPSTSIPALGLTSAAYDAGTSVGEAVALELRDLLFEQGRDVADPSVLAEVAGRHGVDVPDDAVERVRADHEEGVSRGVIGSPHFFTPGHGFFCPSLEIARDDDGHLRISADPEGFDAFVDACLA